MSPADEDASHATMRPPRASAIRNRAMSQRRFSDLHLTHWTSRIMGLRFVTVAVIGG
jgi:hypothetical protein